MRHNSVIFHCSFHAAASSRRSSPQAAFATAVSSSFTRIITRHRISYFPLRDQPAKPPSRSPQIIDLYRARRALYAHRHAATAATRRRHELAGVLLRHATCWQRPHLLSRRKYFITKAFFTARYAAWRTGPRSRRALFHAACFSAESTRLSFSAAGQPFVSARDCRRASVTSLLAISFRAHRWRVDAPGLATLCAHITASGLASISGSRHYRSP